MSFYSNKTALVTGATGLIGSHLVARLLDSDVNRVIAISRNHEKQQKVFSKYLKDKRLICLAHDIVEPLPLTLPHIDFIFHAAGAMERNEIFNKPLDVICANILGLQHCAEYLMQQFRAGEAMGRLILFSSITIYGNRSGISVTEEETTGALHLDDPYAAYAETKRMSEVTALAYHRQHAVDVVIARLSTVYGPVALRPATAFFDFLNSAENGQNIILKNSQFSRRDNIYIDDAVDALMILLEKGVNGQAYNISSGGEKGNFASIDKIAQYVIDETNRYVCDENKKLKVVYPSNEIERKDGLILNNSKLKALGWNLRTSLLEGIRKTMNESRRR